MSGAIEASGSGDAAPAPPPRLPFVVRPSALKNWISTAVFAVVTCVMLLFTSPALREIGIWFVGAGVAFSCLCNLLGGLDRRPRLILEREGLRWRPHLWTPLRFSPWSRVRAAGHRDNPRNHDDGWLELDISGVEDVKAERISIRISGQNAWGEDLPDMIRALAPHVRLLDFDD
ncbi:hypothetical protein AS593_21365 [Caulobacter vibrioides]|nr:hypothetical protein AS593_21365 [Caulobacter vibrioides]